MSFRIKIDTSSNDFKHFKRLLSPEDWAKVSSQAIQNITTLGLYVIRRETRENFKLHTSWVLNNIQAFPQSKTQTTKFQRDLLRGDGFASIYILDRLDFMVMQEEGGTKKPQGKALTIPTTEALSMGGFVSRTGAVNNRWQPKNLFNEGDKKAFTIKANGTDLVVRRKSKKRYPLVKVYTISPEADIKPVWKFIETGEAFVLDNYSKAFEQAFRGLGTI